jgi:hypothetical protein
MDANTERMPGDAEAAGAAAAMGDLYGRRLSIGDAVTYRRDSWPAGHSEPGRIVGFKDGRVLLDTVGDLVEVEVDELLP